MAKRPPVEPGSTGDERGPRRDRRGRFAKGGTRGGGAGTHAYVQRRAALAKALQVAVSPTAFKRLIMKMYQLAMAGNVQAAMFLITQLAGKAPEPLSPVQMGAPERVSREPLMSIEALSARLQRLLEDFEAGKVTAEDTRVSRDILSSLAQVKHHAELEQKLAELRLILERSDHGQPSS